MHQPGHSAADSPKPDRLLEAGNDAYCFTTDSNPFRAGASFSSRPPMPAIPFRCNGVCVSGHLLRTACIRRTTCPNRPGIEKRILEARSNGYWVIEKGERLYRICRYFYPGDRIKLERLRKHLFQRNKAAFLNGEQNRMIVGARLYLPPELVFKVGGAQLPKSTPAPPPQQAQTSYLRFLKALLQQWAPQLVRSPANRRLKRRPPTSTS